MASIISNHNNKVLIDKLDNVDTTYNCKKKDLCPPPGNSCLTPNTIYNANVTAKDTQPQEKNYVGLTEGPFNHHYTQHKHSFMHKKQSNCTKLSKYVWELKSNSKD